MFGNPGAILGRCRSALALHEHAVQGPNLPNLVLQGFGLMHQKFFQVPLMVGVFQIVALLFKGFVDSLNECSLVYRLDQVIKGPVFDQGPLL